MKKMDDELKAAEEIQRLLSQVDDDSFDVRETYPALEAAFSVIWSDPLLDEYGDYDAHKELLQT